MYKIYLYLLVIPTVLLLACCASPRYKESGYECVNRGTCSLPEKINEGNALIYVIRPYRVLNQDERQDLYIKEGTGGREEHYARIFGSTYCPIQTSANQITLRVVGRINDAMLNVRLRPGYTYYVKLVTIAGLLESHLRIKLMMLDKNSGENYLMHEVSSSCLRN
jgi:hypothetical protein